MRCATASCAAATTAAPPSATAGPAGACRASAAAWRAAADAPCPCAAAALAHAPLWPPTPALPATAAPMPAGQAVSAVAAHQLCVRQDGLHAALRSRGGRAAAALRRALPCAARVPARGRRQAAQVPLRALPAVQVRRGVCVRGSVRNTPLTATGAPMHTAALHTSSTLPLPRTSTPTGRRAARSCPAATCAAAPAATTRRALLCLDLSSLKRPGQKQQRQRQRQRQQQQQQEAAAAAAVREWTTLASSMCRRLPRRRRQRRRWQQLARASRAAPTAGCLCRSAAWAGMWCARCPAAQQAPSAVARPAGGPSPAATTAAPRCAMWWLAEQQQQQQQQQEEE
jgi:hypothetical protein